MNNTQARPSDRASQFVRAALLSPDQVEDIVLAPKEAVSDKKSGHPAHAHGDFGHGDFGHADR